MTDIDSANLAWATVPITGNFVNGQDVLGFTTQNGITGSFNAATGVADPHRHRPPSPTTRPRCAR